MNIAIFYKTRCHILLIFNLKSLEYRRIEFDLVLCFKIVNGLCCIKFDDIFSWAKIQARRPNCFQIARKVSRNNAVLNSFAFRVVRTWNVLPQNIVSAPSASAFSNRLKHFDLSTLCDLHF